MKNNSSEVRKLNKRKNISRTNLLIIADDEYRNHMIKSNMKINYQPPKELVKQFEQNYGIQFQVQESPNQSKTSKKRISVYDAAVANKSISLLEDPSVTFIQKRNITDLKKISVSERKLGGMKGGGDLKRTSKILDDSMLSTGYNSNLKQQAFPQNIPFNNSIALNKRIYTRRESDSKLIQDSFNNIQDFCCRYVKGLGTDRQDAEELFDILKCKDAEYEDKLVIPAKSNSTGNTNKLTQNLAENLLKNYGNPIKSKSDQIVQLDQSDKKGGSSSNDAFKKLMQHESQKKGKVPIPKAPKSNNSSTSTDNESFNTNNDNFSTLLKHTKKKDSPKNKVRNSYAIEAVKEEVEAEGAEEFNIDKMGINSLNTLINTQDYTSHKGEIDLNNSQSGSQVSGGDINENQFGSQITHNTHNIGAELNKEGFNTQNSEIGASFQFASNNDFLRASMSSAFGSNLFGTNQDNYCSNISQAKGIPFAVTSDPISLKDPYKNYQPRTTIENLINEDYATKGDYDTNNLTSEMERFRESVSVTVNPKDLKDLNNNEYDTNPDLSKSNITENSLMLNISETK